MPVDDNALGMQLVGDVDSDGVAGIGPDGGARELAVNAHHWVLHAVGCPINVLHIEVVGVVHHPVPTQSCPNKDW